MKCLNKAQRILSSQYENDREITSTAYIFFFNVHSSIDDVKVKKGCDPSAVHTLCLLVQRSKLCTVHY